MRRGFKTWWENAARGYRRELGIPLSGPLDPRLLAAYLSITVWSPAFRGDCRNVKLLLPPRQSRGTPGILGNPHGIVHIIETALALGNVAYDLSTSAASRNIR